MRRDVFSPFYSYPLVMQVFKAMKGDLLSIVGSHNVVMGILVSHSPFCLQANDQVFLVEVDGIPFLGASFFTG